MSHCVGERVIREPSEGLSEGYRRPTGEDVVCDRCRAFSGLLSERRDFESNLKRELHLVLRAASSETSVLWLRATLL
ncbi:unnamed protein product [Gadus morhua 'NCC']